MTLAAKVKEAAEKAYRHGKNYLQLVDADRAATELQPDFLEGITAELDYLVQDYILRQENGTPPAVLADLAAKEVEEYSSSIPVKKIILEVLKRRRHDDGIRLYPRNKRPTAPPPPFGQDYLHHALKLAGFEAIAAHFRALAEPMEQIVPMEQQQPEQRTPPREQIAHDREVVTAAVKFVLSELDLLNTAGKFTGSNRDGTAKALFHVLRTKTYWDAGAGQDKEFAAYWKEQFNGGISVKALGDKHTQSFGADYAKVMALIEKYERENAP